MMPAEDTKILALNRYQISYKALFTIYADLEYLIEKIDNNSENSSTTKVSEHIPGGFSMSTVSSLKAYKISMMCTEVKITWKRFVNP